jgi:hypothetical protein
MLQHRRNVSIGFEQNAFSSSLPMNIFSIFGFIFIKKLNKAKNKTIIGFI